MLSHAAVGYLPGLFPPRPARMEWRPEGWLFPDRRSTPIGAAKSIPSMVATGSPTAGAPVPDPPGDAGAR